MRTFDELEALWQAAAPPPRDRGTIGLIVRRTQNRRHDTPEAAQLTQESGLVGDRWELDPGRQVVAQIAVMNLRAAQIVCADHEPLDAPGDNLLVDLDLSEAALPVGTRLLAGTALLEVTAKPHAGCRKFSDKFGQDALRWVNWREFRPRRLRGLYCRVVQPGAVRQGDPIRRADGEREG